MCAGLPAATSAASMMASERVGWGWLVTRRSSKVAPISRASVPSVINSDGCRPTVVKLLILPT